jgi:hypothetical protein
LSWQIRQEARRETRGGEGFDYSGMKNSQPDLESMLSTEFFMALFGATFDENSILLLRLDKGLQGDF